MSKRMKVILTISLLLNILLIGVLGGHAYRTHSDERKGFHELKASLSDETQKMLKDEMYARKDKIKSMKRQMKAFIGEFERISTQDTFDVAAYDAFSKRFIEFDGEVTRRRLEMFKDMALVLSVEERRTFSKMMSKKIMGRYMRGHDRYGPHKKKHGKDHHDKHEKKKKVDDE